MDATSTPHGKLREPAVVMSLPGCRYPSRWTNTRGQPKTRTSDFKRFVCWGEVRHLRTGRNGCNADGTKVTAMTATSSQTSQASMLVSACTTTVKVCTDPESRVIAGVLADGNSWRCTCEASRSEDDISARALTVVISLACDHRRQQRRRALEPISRNNARMHRLLLALICMLASPAATAGSAPERMLIFSKTAGFRHESIPTAVATLRQLAQEQGMPVDLSEDADVFTADNLARYRVVAFASTTGEILAPAQQQAFEGFIRQGGGFLGVHSAADTGYQWPWYGRLVGAWFKKHPPGLQSTRVQPEREGRPVGDAWPITDEIYNYRHNPRGQVQVVATIDERLYAGGTMGADHPIAWCHAFDGGRAWYTGLGHDAAVYANADFLVQLRQGLRYAAGHVPDC